MFTPYFSRDSSKVLIYADKESSSSDVIPHIYILNGNFESIWDAPLSLSSDKKGIKPMGITLSNNGAVYLLALADNGVLEKYSVKIIGADINAIKELLGHANLSATQVYTHNTIEKLKSVYKQAHPRA